MYSLRRFTPPLTGQGLTARINWSECCSDIIRSFSVFFRDWNLTESAAWLYSKGVTREDTWDSGRLLSPCRLGLVHQCASPSHVKAPGPLESSTQCSFLLTSHRIAIEPGPCSEIFRGFWPPELKNAQCSWHFEWQGILGQGPGWLTLQKTIQQWTIIFSGS
jgi:hypothetical protein